MTHLFNQKSHTKLRKDLRNQISQPEVVLWQRLRRKQLGGYRFRRQFGIGRYVVDFYCPKLRLVIEIDGDSHYTDEAQAYDAERTEYLNNCGIQVLRYTNTEIMKNVDGVVERISEVVSPPYEGGARGG
ncbi:MAG: hypothetical protein A3E36_03870 [Candidatus Andersenbacteria bacterium RIFCSPHIGHO2_12_FULL_45_11b]|uniref:DUF559 domain-containing protein n=1 Tax=Candidatus Andersenbacteria bacterium RIFCSPHIGHO2_12_FULL_45_11b TaxID=1797282 RepID=A0A1G1X9F3_9BACT|nr:MAG: hypothetical protein A3E36_03870 [Candidatus Andersenbacteria bacterium RIFCSPHIGHO2_12_FULL_45_11b]